MIFSSMMRKGLVVTVWVLSTFFFCNPLLAQQVRVVKGVVLDAKNIPIADASIKVQPNGAVTKTDKDGKFSLSIPAGNQLLLVTHVGKTSQEIRVGSKDYYVVNLSDVGFGPRKCSSGWLWPTEKAVVWRAPLHKLPEKCWNVRGCFQRGDGLNGQPAGPGYFFQQRYAWCGRSDDHHSCADHLE